MTDTMTSQNIVLSSWDTLYTSFSYTYRGAEKSLGRPIPPCVLFDDENISFDARLVICINITNIPSIMIINRIYEHQNLLPR
jgi:hypothetical protein